MSAPPPVSQPSLPPRLREVVDGLAALSDRGERIEALIAAAKPYPEAAKVPAC